MSAATLYLTLKLDDECVGLPVARVREIFEPHATTRVPGAPKAFRGVINLRGSVVPVVDLGAVLGIRETPSSEPRCVVLLEAEIDGERSLVGLACDSVEEVVLLTAQEVGATPAFGTKVPAHQLVGLARSRGAFVLLLDVERALANIGNRAAAKDAADTGSAGSTAAHD